MNAAQTIPLLGKPTEIRNRVVDVLAEEWPLTAKQVYERAVSQGASLTYQAVHKTLKQLAEEGVVERLGDGYALAEEWVQRLRGFAETVAVE